MIQKSNAHFTDKGFTLVEIIIVIVVIGILAAITVVGFGTWRTNVAETEVKSDAINVKTSMEDARNRTNSFPVLTSGTEFDGGSTTRGIFVSSKNVRVTYVSGNALGYCINIQSREVPTVNWFVNTAGGNDEPQSGTC